MDLVFDWIQAFRDWKGLVGFNFNVVPMDTCPLISDGLNVKDQGLEGQLALQRRAFTDVSKNEDAWS